MRKGDASYAVCLGVLLGFAIVETWHVWNIDRGLGFLVGMLLGNKAWRSWREMEGKL